MDDAAVRRRRLAARRPRHIAIDDEDRVGIVEQRRRVIAEMAGVVGRQRQVAQTVLDDRDRKTLGEFGERRHRGMVAAGIGGDDQRVLRGGEDPGGGDNRHLVRRRRRGGDPARWRIVGEAGQGLGQHLARQGEIDRPLGRAGRQGQGAIDHGFELSAVAQLVIPFDHLAQHAGLVEHLLRPVDVGVARPGEPRFGQRRAAGGEQDRHILARRVEDAADRVGGADADMHHDRRHPPRRHRIAMRHRQRQVLMRRDQRLRRRQPAMRRLGIGLDDRCEIGAGIGEQVFDAALGQQREIGLGHAVDVQFLARHAALLPLSVAHRG